ncbi:hypothetical protein [Micromonospora sediminimaris]|uniref:Uncharacterized protein n=1 Tax=Micromonospora sediminimaris TaxID=547162 RepID=A0A9W5UWL2_9ACTN|nr:hypothetical protein [Micromonospora sediminimaris]GIJ36159.1 hypothetical protein Vse01_53070 [Micromonospora sediminimaris]
MPEPQASTSTATTPSILIALPDAPPQASNDIRPGDDIGQNPSGPSTHQETFVDIVALTSTDAEGSVPGKTRGKYQPRIC